MTTEQVTWLTSFAEVTEAYLVREGLEQATYDGGKDLILRDVLITLDGEPHQLRRRLEAPLFNRRLQRVYEGRLIPSILDETLTRHVREGRADLVPLAHLICTRIAARVAGIDGHESAEAADDLRAMMIKLHEGAIVGFSKRPLEDVRRDVAAAEKAYGERFFKPSLARRQALVAQYRAGALAMDDLPYDLLTMILAHQGGKEDAGIEWDEGLMLRETVHYLIAGAHTPATGVVQVVNDLFQWFAAHPEDRAQVADLDFVHHATSESLRVNPPSQVQMRRATRDIQLSSGRRIAAGEVIGLDLTAANRDTAVFGPDAADYNPHRPHVARVPRYGHAFSTGAHVCIGKNLAIGTGVGESGEHTDGGERIYGMVARIVAAFFAEGVAPDPDQAPAANPLTRRLQFAVYPVRFSGR